MHVHLIYSKQSVTLNPRCEIPTTAPPEAQIRLRSTNWLIFRLVFILHFTWGNFKSTMWIILVNKQSFSCKETNPTNYVTLISGFLSIFTSMTIEATNTIKVQCNYAPPLKPIKGADGCIHVTCCPMFAWRRREELRQHKAARWFGWQGNNGTPPSSRFSVRLYIQSTDCRMWLNFVPRGEKHSSRSSGAALVSPNMKVRVFFIWCTSLFDAALFCPSED